VLVTHEPVFCYHCLSVNGVQLTDQELANTFIQHHNCLLTRILMHLSRHPSSSSLMMNHKHILVRAVHCGIQLNVATSDRFFNMAGRPIQVNPLAPEFPFKFQHTLYLKCE